MNKNRTRRKRRTLKQVLKYGEKAKSSHKSRSGRTGQVHHKKMKSLKDAAKRTR